jgi:hypothetical protein
MPPLLAAVATLSGCAVTGSAPASNGAPAAAAAPVAPRREAGAESVALIRSGDVTEVNDLARSMTAGASGDPAWIEVFGQLRAQSWLATRYPGRYPVAEIYRGEAADAADANEAEHLALGVYLDEPLPTLMSVSKTRQLGDLVELEVVLEAGPATVRGELDDQPRGVLPGGVHRGLFTIGRDGSDDAWRIHSVAELHVVDRATGQEPKS